MAKLSRDRILSVAQEAVVRDGHESVSLRALARELEVTAPALYDHFPSKDALLRAVAEKGFFALIEALDVDGDRAIDRVRHRALRYVGFAADHPDLFRLMFLFRPGAIDVVTDDGMALDNELAAATDAFEGGAVDLAKAVADGDLIDRDINDMAMIVWVTMHGVATVALTAPVLAAAVAEDVVDTMLAGLLPR